MNPWVLICEQTYLSGIGRKIFGPYQTKEKALADIESPSIRSKIDYISGVKIEWFAIQLEPTSNEDLHKNRLKNNWMRVGGHTHRTLYLTPEKPSKPFARDDNGVFIGSVDTEDLAISIANAWNLIYHHDC